MSNSKIYNKAEIISGLEEQVSDLIDWTENLSEDNFFKSINGKWSAGEQLEHLRKSSKPLVMALKLPKLVIKLKVGKANRPSRSFAEVTAKYQTKLAQQDIGRTPYYPDANLNKSRQEIVDSYRLVSEKLVKEISKWQEEDLDTYILPHPLLGKMTVREMLFFTIYHTRHHHQSLTALHA